MRTFAVWETEYPDEGSLLFAAWTDKGAARKYRRCTQTRGPDMPVLSTCEMTPDMLKMRKEANT